MTFDIYKLVQSVLEFYYSSGIADINVAPLKVKHPAFGQLDGNKQRLEQMLFFVLGHLLPEYAPLSLEFDYGKEALANKETLCLKIKIDLPSVSKTSLEQLMETLENDTRLKKLVQLSEADVRVHGSKEKTTPSSLSIYFPVASVSEPNQEPILNIEELKTRYESLDLAFTLLEGFVMNARRHVTLLQNAVDKKDWQEAHRHAHALKGGALNVCAESFVKKAREIELAIKEERYLDAEDFANHLEQSCYDLETAWTNYREVLHG